MRTAHFLLVLSICATPVAWSNDVGGQTPARETDTSSPFVGRWRAAETADEKEQRLQAIDEATEGMRAFRRGRARSRLAERTSPQATLIMELEGSKLTIGPEDRRIELEVGGSPIEVSESEGTARVSARMEGQRLIVMARSDQGERTTTYEANGDRLAVEVTMTSTELAGPLHYVSTYARLE
jgi:hypothetical protein